MWPKLNVENSTSCDLCRVMCGTTLPTDFHLRTIGRVACPRAISALFHGQPELEIVQSVRLVFTKTIQLHFLSLVEGKEGKRIKIETKLVFLYQVNSKNNITFL